MVAGSADSRNMIKTQRPRHARYDRNEMSQLEVGTSRHESKKYFEIDWPQLGADAFNLHTL